MEPTPEPEKPADEKPLGQPDAPTTCQGGVVGLDIGPALHDAQVLELLRQLGIDKKP